MKGLRHNYFVGIIQKDNSIKFVTRIDNTTKTAFWTDGCQARIFKKTEADDMLYYLHCNAYNAVVIKSPAWCMFCNPEPTKGE